MKFILTGIMKLENRKSKRLKFLTDFDRMFSFHICNLLNARNYMKTIFILRTAMSEELREDKSDFERRLSPEGYSQAISIGEKFYEKGINVDKIFSSTAKRAKQTAVIAKTVGSLEAKIEYKNCLYGISLLKFQRQCFEIWNDLNSVLIVGHNPALEILVQKITGLPLIFNPAMVLKIVFDVNNWQQIIDTENSRIDLIIEPQNIYQKTTRLIK